MNKDIQKRFSIREDQPSAWFEPLYANANKAGEGIPWANMKTQPNFSKWLSNNKLDGARQSALVVGCGMGDDAIELESLGFKVTAFDVSDAAIKLCKERFPQSKVDFLQADLLETQSQWHQAFDFVVEICTLQALPPKYETPLIQNISDFVALKGRLLVIADVSTVARSFENGPPWLLNANHVDAFLSSGLELQGQYVDEDSFIEGYIGVFVSTFTRSPS